MSTATIQFYVTGGTLRYDSACYVQRRADNELFDSLLKGEFCYVLTSRQMGKSSLVARTARKLREQKVRVAILDLTAVGQNLTPEQWYDGLVANTGNQLRAQDELEEYWLRSRLGPAQRFFGAIREVLVKRSTEPLVIFIDEVDTVRSLPFSSDEFFAAIRECYNRRSEEPALNLLTFCLLGVATASELIRDPQWTPFNMGRQIELTDFTHDESASLLPGLGSDEKRRRELLARILYWTRGHPYLTQRLCRAAAEAMSLVETHKAENRRFIDRLCEDLFLSMRARDRDDNLLFVRERLLRSDVELADLLALYDRIRNYEPVQDSDSDPLVKVLRMSGVVRSERGELRVRNRIYERVFDHDWVMANMPVINQSKSTAIAVLPLVDASTESPNEYWADGLTEQLINALGQVSGLTVASLSSTFQFKGKRENLREIGSRLNVDVVLEGILWRLGNRVRISVELVSVADGYRLWAETFNYRVKDLFEIQDEITGAIVARLRFGLRSQSDWLVVKAPTDNLEAYNLYLKGRYQWNKRHHEAVKRSVTFFEEAIRLDPRFALAYAGLADAFSILGMYNYQPPVEVYPRAKSAVLKALEVDEKLPQAHAALGCVSAIYDWDWLRSETAFRRAIQLNPSYAQAHQWYAINCLTPLGRHDESINELRKAQAVDPLSLGVQASLALAFYYAGHYHEAIKQCRLTLDMEESFWVGSLFLSWAYLQSRLFDEAIAICERARDLANNDPTVIAALGHVHAATGNRNEAEQYLQQLLELAHDRYVPASEISILYLGLGNLDEAMNWLSKARDEKSLRLIYLKVEPRLNPLRSDPRFVELLARVGL